MTDWRGFWGWTLASVALTVVYLLVWGTDGKLGFSIVGEGAGLVLLVIYGILTLIAHGLQHKSGRKPE